VLEAVTEVARPLPPNASAARARLRPATRVVVARKGTSIIDMARPRDTRRRPVGSDASGFRAAVAEEDARRRVEARRAGLQTAQARRRDADRGGEGARGARGTSAHPRRVPRKDRRACLDRTGTWRQQGGIMSDEAGPCEMPDRISAAFERAFRPRLAHL